MTGEAEALCEAAAAAEEVTEGREVPFPVEPGGPFGDVDPPPRGSSIAFAPKLRLLLKGVMGLGEDMLADGGGSSSKGDSSTEPELALDTDSARARMVV